MVISRAKCSGRKLSDLHYLLFPQKLWLGMLFNFEPALFIFDFDGDIWGKRQSIWITCKRWVAFR